MAREAIAGWEKSETEAISLKLDLEKALQQRAASEERLIHLDAALKERIQQLRFVREEQEKRILDAVMKVSNEHERSSMELLAKLDKADSENTRLGKALLVKEKVVEELNKHRAKAEADFDALMARLESTEKANASLEYEVRVLEKEIEIWNEKREFNRRTADVSHKQHLENVKKIAKLESECQKLRLLVMKWLPGPGALAKMKYEMEVLAKDQPETRKKSNPPLIGSMDFSVDMASETPRKQISYLTEQLYAMEGKNRTLKKALNKRTNELQLSRTMFAQTTSKLSQLEGHLGDHSVAEPGKNLYSTDELSLASMLDMGSDDKASCAESWASALISELEQFKNAKKEDVPLSRKVGASDMSLMGRAVTFRFVSVPNCLDSHLQVEEVYPHRKGEDGRLKDESPNNESAKKDLEGRLQVEILKSESLMFQLQESCKTIESLQKEVETLEQLKEKIEDQSEKHKMVKEDLETQLNKAKIELNKACDELMYLERELENKNSTLEKLDATCHDLQLQLVSVDKRETQNDKMHTGRQLHNESETATASEKLAECQETILNLGKQLKALASPPEAALSDKVIFNPADNIAAALATPKVISNPAVDIAHSMTTPEKKVHQRSSLLDKMLAEDKAEIDDPKSPKTKEIILDGDRYSASHTYKTPETLERFTNPTGVDHHKNEAVVGSLAIVRSKKGGRGFLRKLLWRGKKNSGEKNDLLIC